MKNIKWSLRTLHLVSEQPDGKDWWKCVSFLPYSFPFDCKYTTFQYSFFLKEKPHRKIIMRLAKTALSQTICYMEQAPSSSPEKGNDYTVRLWVPSVRRMLNSVEWGSVCCPSPIQWTICLYQIASPERITSGRPAFDSLLPLAALTEVRSVGHGLNADTAKYKSRAKPEFNILIKD